MTDNTVPSVIIGQRTRWRDSKRSNPRPASAQNGRHQIGYVIDLHDVNPTPSGSQYIGHAGEHLSMSSSTQNPSAFNPSIRPVCFATAFCAA